MKDIIVFLAQVDRKFKDYFSTLKFHLLLLTLSQNKIDLVSNLLLFFSFLYFIYKSASGIFWGGGGGQRQLFHLVSIYISTSIFLR